MKKVISLRLGNNFDLKVTEIVQKIDRTKTRVEVDMLYKVKNSSDNPKTVEVLVPFNQNKYSEVDSRENYTMKHGNMVSFLIDVEANSTKKFKVYYTTLFR